ncbi:Uncharacterized protein FKW44_002001 [Caligus rogercresseyi]|uniref:Probable ATP-dependent RNA helicase DDX46 n=1 Tax=Caligus rogercresseyi TaxID=217165 RepID=A0A7T8KJJ1_CALRO|nr:Uncharacterized protein FKW44_002001 [Caligus rogercresseyi]
MQKRRERIEKWRAEKRKKELCSLALKELIVPSARTKIWSLEDDKDDDEEEEATGKVPKEDNNQEEDPLESYMKEVNKEVKKLRGVKGPKTEKGSGGVLILTGVAKAKDSGNAKRGELIEQNQDGLEYSSEEDEDTNLDEAMSQLAKKGRKELTKIDHKDIAYQPFLKNFYREVPELTKMTQEEVDAYRSELEGIKVKGKNAPKPIKNWTQAGVSQRILDLLKRNGYEKPTPIQAQAVPIVMSGRDMIGIAKTGSGKTLAFLLPLFRHIMAQPELEEGDGPIAIIMTPTRELCMQIGKEIRKFSKAIKGARSVCVYGGTGISEQIAELKRGAEIIVCTPGRMIDMLAANNGRVTNCRRITYVVLDEADRMFDMGFEPQVSRIIGNCRPDKQMVMFSATFPRQMEGLARRILNKPVEVTVGGRSVVCKDIEQSVYVLDEEQKFLKLLELLGQRSQEGLIIIFVDKQEHADSLLKDLMSASYSSCASLHGGVDQYDRDSIITNFKNGKLKILVATSVAARGLDIKELVLVVNYDCPNHYEDYVHRCGRTGRAGNRGYAATFLSPEQGRYAGEVIKAMELSDSVVPVSLRELWDKYKTKSESEGKVIKTGSGGFGGSGFKFDESEATYTTEKKKFQKAAFGLQDSDDEDVEQEIEQQIEQLLNPKRTVKNVSTPGSNTGAVAAPVEPKTSSGAADKLKLAKRLASKINLKANAKNGAENSNTTSSFMLGTQSKPLITAKTVADHIASKINAKLNYQPSEESSAPEGSAFKSYEEELVINDFPQLARWKVASKEALAQISEYSDAVIKVRGTYYPVGKPIPEGERKLFLAIESTCELSVQKAKVEITRLLKEELLKMKTSGIQHINKGRYKVL